MEARDRSLRSPSVAVKGGRKCCCVPASRGSAAGFPPECRVAAVPNVQYLTPRAVTNRQTIHRGLQFTADQQWARYRRYPRLFHALGTPALCRALAVQISGKQTKQQSSMRMITIRASAAFSSRTARAGTGMCFNVISWRSTSSAHRPVQLLVNQPEPTYSHQSRA